MLTLYPSPLLLAVALVLLLGGCRSDELVTVVPGSVVTINRLQTEDFASIQVEDGIELTLVPGNSDTMVLEMPAGFLGHVTTDVIGGRLFVSLKDHVDPSGFEPRRIRLAAPTLERVIGSGGCTILAPDTLTYPSMEITVSGGSTVEFFRVGLMDANITSSGGSHTHITAHQTLHVTASGASEIRYKGRPTITQSLSGGSRIVDSN